MAPRSVEWVAGALSPRAYVFFSRLLWALCLATAATLPGCRGESSGPSVTATGLVSAVALSNHYVELAFSEPAPERATDPTAYVILDENGVSLPVLGAEITSDPRRVVLTTGPQLALIYTLTASALFAEPEPSATRAELSGAESELELGVSFQGSLGDEPIIVSSVPLTNTSVLVTFSERMDRTSLANVRHYRFRDPDGDPDIDIAVVAVAPESDNISVVLTTTPQQNIEYELRVSGIFVRGVLSNTYVNPFFNSTTFQGIAAVDSTPPRVRAASSLSPTEVLVSFSEPLANEADDPLNFTILDRRCAPDCPALTVTAAEASTHRTQMLLTTEPQALDGQYVVTVTNVRDRSGNLIDPGGNSAQFLSSQQDMTRARVVGAIATSNRTVHITYSKPMGNSALEPLNYLIVQVEVNAEVGTLVVAGETIDGVTYPRFTDATRTAVEIATSSQNEVTYEITAVNVRDLSGNQLAPPELLVDPSRARFAGSPAGGPARDTDGDGLSDAAELRGRVVVVTRANGEQTTREVTSDPTLVDTDGDNLDDALELEIGSDPRSADTDGDRVSDAEEWNDWYSDPCDQDSDNDGLSDGLETIDLGTSPILADTDGDQMNDLVEITQRNRNPRIADIPRPQIIVDGFRLDVEVTSSFTDEQGTTQAIEDSLSSTFAQSRSNTLARSDTTSTTAENESSQDIGFEVGGSAKDGFSGKVTGNVGFGQRQSRGFTSSVSSESAVASQQEYQNSVSRAFEQSESRAVTRTIESAIVQATVNIGNQSDIAFTIQNIEVAVLQQDRRSGLSFRPIAVLRPAGAGLEAAYNLGPFDRERGPIIFESSEVFPNLVDDLMREPSGLVFEVVNFDILDELGRNFVFSSQEVNDRTAGISIDYGNGVVESYRVATNSPFGLDGRALGITLEEALTLAGIERRDGEDTLGLAASEATTTYGVVTDTISGTERLTRVRGVQSETLERSSATSFWAVLTSNARLAEDADFGTIPVRAGDSFLFAYTKDTDQDGLLAREENLYGSDDTDTNSDSDELDDFAEVRTGWTVNIAGRAPYRTFSSPARTDSDLDGLTDDQELALGTDPNRADTDEDGLTDALEVNGPIEVILYDGDADDTNNVLLTVNAYSGTDTDCTSGTSATDDRVAHRGCFATDPLDPDTDNDGQTDGREVIAGIDPNLDDAAGITDSDGDGLSDAEEIDGWVRAAPCAPTDTTCRSVVTSNPLRPDTDLDGIPDVFERALGSDPTRRDTDGDSLFDIDEFDRSDADRYYDANALADARARCAAADHCAFGADEPPANARLRTNVNAIDSDGDTIRDDVEIQRTYVVSFIPPSGGTQTRTVSSRPYSADHDQDGLDDAAEFIARTDPNGPDGFDTDQDGTSDGDEGTICLADGTTCRNPLRADQLVTFTYTSVDVIQDCDAESAGLRGLDLRGTLQLQTPDGTLRDLQNYPCQAEGDREAWDDGTNNPINISREFLLRSGESFAAKSTTMVDDDGDCTTPVGASLGSFDQTYSFPTTPGGIPGGSALVSYPLAPAGDCSIRFNASISVR